MHLTPYMSFEKVQRLAFSLGTSLRQTILQSNQTTAKAKVPLGSNTFHHRPFRPLVGSHRSRRKSRRGARRFGHCYTSPDRGRHGSYSTPVRLFRLVSPDGSSFLGILFQVPVAKCGVIPTRGSLSPGASVMSEPMKRVRSISPSRVGGNKQPICFLCYGPGHFLAECPRLPPVLPKEAADNRETFQKNGPRWSRPPPGPSRTPALETQTGTIKMEQSTHLESRTAPVHVVKESQGQATLSQEEYLDYQHRDSSENAEEGS
jgi:hypothetical protein